MSTFVFALKYGLFLMLIERGRGGGAIRLCARRAGPGLEVAMHELDLLVPLFSSIVQSQQ